MKYAAKYTNQWGVHKGYTSIPRHKGFRAKGYLPHMSNELYAEDIIQPDELQRDYIESLPVYTQHHDDCPRYNPDNISENYILLTPDGTYLMDTHGGEYTSYVFRIGGEWVANHFFYPRMASGIGQERPGRK